MAVSVLSKMIHRTGGCPLPVHDSFLVPELDAHILRETMMEIHGNSDSPVTLGNRTLRPAWI
jgi:hypothetical protein